MKVLNNFHLIFQVKGFYPLQQNSFHLNTGPETKFM